MTPLGGIAFAYYREFFPKAQTLVGKYLHKAIETPVIVHHAVANASPGALFGVTPVIIKPSGDTDTDRAGDSFLKKTSSYFLPTSTHPKTQQLLSNEKGPHKFSIPALPKLGTMFLSNWYISS